MQHQKRDSFKSKFGAIAALAGSAVGLGNIWKFPYEAGSNGGGAFLLVYIFYAGYRVPGYAIGICIRAKISKKRFRHI